MILRVLYFLLYVAALLLGTGCAHRGGKRVPVTASARQSVTEATGAVDEGVRASERSSGHIRTLRGHASRIEFKSIRALKLLD